MGSLDVQMRLIKCLTTILGKPTSILGLSGGMEPLLRNRTQVFPFFFFKSKGLEICFPLVILKVNFSPITDLSPITSSTVSHTASVKLLLRCHLVFCVINILPKLPGFAPPHPPPPAPLELFWGMWCWQESGIPRNVYPSPTILVGVLSIGAITSCNPHIVTKYLFASISN